MASKSQQAQRYIKIINQQLEILNGEKQSVMETLDHTINQVLSEVNAWVNRGHVNHITYAEMSNRIQQVIHLFMAKSAEISDLEIDDSKSDSGLLQTTAASSNNLRNPKTSYTRDQEQDKTMSSRVKTVQVCGDPIETEFKKYTYLNTGADDTYITTTRFAILEEAAFSLKKTTEQIQEKQENVNKKLEILTNANLKSKKKCQERFTELEKTSNENQERLEAMERSSTESSSNVDDLFESVTNVDVKLSSLENENKYINASMNELNEEISSVRSCSNDALMSIQDLSKRIESTNQHYNDMSNKINQLEVSIHLLSTQYTEQLETMSIITKEKVDETIGLACQMLAKRLAPLDKLNEILNKKAESRKCLSQEDAVENQVTQLNEKIAQLELKCNFPNVGFFAWTTIAASQNLLLYVRKFDHVDANYGNHFDSLTGKFTVPLNGSYLISMSASQEDINGKMYAGCYLRSNNRLFEEADPVIFLNGTWNQSVTRCSEMSAGDVIYLKSAFAETHPKNKIMFYFSCFMIKG
ncbi:unnamed protein product [Lymnaea stagnalis]|uniref:C1q domain-containing protein n=1 Tax=Lymnaea stagnalis TaxID=6523 RepID=A0AAV2I9V3_LYMST